MKNGLELVAYILLLLAAAPLLGRYMAFIFSDGEKTTLPVFGWLEKKIYIFCGIDPVEEMGWKEYAKALLLFNGFGLIFLFLLQLLQGILPLNPQSFPGVKLDLAWNTAISFVTNTNWQAYGGENTMSYLTQMMGMTVQNFCSAATGNAVLLALIRGLMRSQSKTIGNFWSDLTRTVLYLLLPLSIIFSLFLASEGVPQTLNPYVEATTLENHIQTIPLGPVASQIAIKQLGTNGGGFFNANSSHPFENPTPLTHFFEAFALLLIPAASVFMYGAILKLPRQAIVIFLVMSCLWVGGLGISLYSESIINPVLSYHPILEGKETRFGLINSILWTVGTTATSNGSVNSMIESLSPLSGGVALFNMMIGEVIFGGVGVGLCAMLMFALLTVFLSGLMVGRTPEYLSKKIEKGEMQWVMLAIIAPSTMILIGSGVASLVPEALASLGTKGPHGLSVLLYAFSSAAGNNGSAFAGLNANTTFYNIFLGFIMLLSRLAILIPSLAIAGSLAQKRSVASSSGTFGTDTPLFGSLLCAVILIVGGLTFFPALSLGPIVEHIIMLRGGGF